MGQGALPAANRPFPEPAVAPTALEPALGAGQRAVLDVLRLALRDGQVFVALVGSPGAGMKAVMDALLGQQHNATLRTIRIHRPTEVSATLARQIEQVALAEAAKPGTGKHVVLAVDDAHAATDDLLRCLTRLAAAPRGAPQGAQRVPQVFLAGLPRLWDRLAAPEYAPLLSRLALRPTLGLGSAAPWAAAEAKLTRALEQPAPGSVPQPTPATAGASFRPPTALDALLATGASAPAPIPAPRRRGAGILVPLLVLLATAGAGLYGLSTMGWPPRRLADAGWDEARRLVPSLPPAPWRAGKVQTAAVPEAPRIQPPPTEQAAPPPIPPTQASMAPPEAEPAQPVPAALQSPALPSPVMEVVPAPPPAPPPAVPDAPAAMAALQPPAPPSPVVEAAPVVPTTPLPTPVPAAADASPPPTPLSVPAQAAPLPAAVRSVSPEVVTLLLRRGDERLALGDVSAARLLYERAAASGSTRAARLAARTYDTAFLPSGSNGTLADREAALSWYRRAAAGGDAEAAERLRQLDGTR